MIGAISRIAVATVLVAAVAGCHSSSTTSQMAPSGSGSLSATIDGASFVADVSTITVMPTSFAVPGSVTIGGSQLIGAVNTTSISLSLGYIPGPGTYRLGVDESTTTGGTASIRVVTSATLATYTTGLTGSSGTVTITIINSTQVEGTFQFTAQPSPGQSGPAKTVTNGKFAVPANGFTVAPASTPGSLMAATLNGVAFNPASIKGTGEAATSISVAGTTQDAAGVTTAVNLMTNGTVAAGGVYPLAQPPDGGTWIFLNVIVGDVSFGGTKFGESGTVTITSLSGNRVKGTFSGTLTGGMSVTNGSFDVKLQ